MQGMQAEQKEQGERLKKIEEEPADKWNSLVKTVITVIATAFVTYLLAKGGFKLWIVKNIGLNGLRRLGIRAIGTVAQTAVALIGTNAIGITEVNWVGVAKRSGTCRNRISAHFPWWHPPK